MYILYLTVLIVFLSHSHMKQITRTKCLKIVLRIQKYKKYTVFGALLFIIHLGNIHQQQIVMKAPFDLALKVQMHTYYVSNVSRILA